MTSERAIEAARALDLCLDGGCCTKSSDPNRRCECGCIDKIALALEAYAKGEVEREREACRADVVAQLDRCREEGEGDMRQAKTWILSAIRARGEEK